MRGCAEQPGGPLGTPQVEQALPLPAPAAQRRGPGLPKLQAGRRCHHALRLGFVLLCCFSPLLDVFKVRVRARRKARECLLKAVRVVHPVSPPVTVGGSRASPCRSARVGALLSLCASPTLLPQLRLRRGTAEPQGQAGSSPWPLLCPPQAPCLSFTPPRVQSGAGGPQRAAPLPILLRRVAAPRGFLRGLECNAPGNAGPCGARGGFASGLCLPQRRSRSSSGQSAGPGSSAKPR